jgi:dynein heavy chain
MKKLEDYLETKRGEFPRFSFLSNDELLEILAKQSDPNAIQGFLKQLFDGLYKLELTETNDSSAMLSREGEKIEFKKPVKHVNKVEEWLNRIQDEMRQTLTRRLKEGNSAFGDGKQTKKEWVMDQPA